MQLNLNSSNQANNLLKLAINVSEAKMTEKLQEANNKVQPEQINTNNTLERTEQADSVSFANNDAEMAKCALRGASTLFVAGLCFGISPLLFLGASAAYIFMNNGDSFKDKIMNTVSKDLPALKKFQETLKVSDERNAGSVEQTTSNILNVAKAIFQQLDPQSAQAPQAAQAEAPQQAENSTVSNPIESAKAPEQNEAVAEQRELTPQEKAQQRYEKAQAYQARAEQNLQKKEEAQRLAEEKVNVAQAKLDQAQVEYDQANAQMKMQMTDRMMKLQESLSTKQANAAVAQEKTNVARALLQEAGVKLEKAQRAFEDAKAEEIVAG